MNHYYRKQHFLFIIATTMQYEPVVIIRDTDKYVDVAALCASLYKGDIWSDYFGLSETQTFFQQMADQTGIPLSLLTSLDAATGHLWLHSYCAYHFAASLHPRCSVIVVRSLCAQLDASSLTDSRYKIDKQAETQLSIMKMYFERGTMPVSVKEMAPILEAAARKLGVSAAAVHPVVIGPHAVAAAVAVLPGVHAQVEQNEEGGWFARWKSERRDKRRSRRMSSNSDSN